MADERKESAGRTAGAETPDSETWGTAEAAEETVRTAGAQPETADGEETMDSAADGQADSEGAESVTGSDSAAGEDADDETADDAQADGAGDEGADSAAKGGDKKSRFFGKKKDDKKDQQIAELTDKVKRQMAEFDNFRKRTEKEKTAMFEIGARSVLEKLLPVVDNFERGLVAIPEAEKESSTAVGMEKIYKQIEKMLEELDVKPIEAVGQEFSPDFHNAVMQAEEEGVGENIIVEEFQKGYLYRGSVLRHSMVKVNK